MRVRSTARSWLAVSSIYAPSEACGLETKRALGGHQVKRALQKFWISELFLEILAVLVVNHKPQAVRGLVQPVDASFDYEAVLQLKFELLLGSAPENFGPLFVLC